MIREKKTFLRWLLAAGVVGALIGGMASAEQPECYVVYACGSASYGGYIYCTMPCGG